METISCVPVFSSITDQTLCLSIGQTTVVSKLKVRWFVKQQVRNKWVKRIRQNPSLIFVLSGVSGGCLRQIKFYLKVAMLQVFALKSRTLRFPCCAKSRSATTSPTRAEARKPSFSSKTRPAAIRQMSLTPTCWRENSKSTSRSRKSWTLKRLLTSRWSRGASVAERELWKTIKYIPFFTQVAA